jgi:hypothetical protein
MAPLTAEDQVVVDRFCEDMRARRQRYGDAEKEKKASEEVPAPLVRTAEEQEEIDRFYEEANRKSELRAEAEMKACEDVKALRERHRAHWNARCERWGKPADWTPEDDDDAIERMRARLEEATRFVSDNADTFASVEQQWIDAREEMQKWINNDLEGELVKTAEFLAEVGEGDASTRIIDIMCGVSREERAAIEAGITEEGDDDDDDDGVHRLTETGAIPESMRGFAFINACSPHFEDSCVIETLQAVITVCLQRCLGVLVSSDWGWCIVDAESMQNARLTISAALAGDCDHCPFVSCTRDGKLLAHGLDLGDGEVEVLSVNVTRCGACGHRDVVDPTEEGKECTCAGYHIAAKDLTWKLPSPDRDPICLRCIGSA